MILSFLTRTPWALQCLLLLAAILLAGCLGLGAVVHIQAARLDAAKVKLAVMGGKIEEQNRAVATWKDKADDQAAQVKAASKKAAKVRTITIERVRTVTVASIPPACPDAIKWAADQGAVFGRRWESQP